ncbi:glucose/galactose MFS transporter [Sphingomonas sp. AR_OL41]|uniref:glucose/galactose MFS transporter n=1 Tax=Sphingomonas sp. AR_OL41 TaxID=3042729 RepID=UPI002480162A|nr:glucose/galactose MFS transporter [Sphingomonas sp. AR_OL41]MDH7972822.1 glucose/galactose MFS transporter [Sphingomonas sp. AR_OL41]
MKVEQPSASTQIAFACVTTLFFAWGFITSLIDPLVAAVKGIFSLSDVEAQLSASAFFIAYGVVSLPAAALLARRKSVVTVLIALMLMIAGCVLMLVASNLAIYELVLFGLFVLASGITILQVAANPLAAALGRPDRSHLRLTLSQAFNSLGTFIGPYLGASLFLKGVEIKQDEQLSATVRASALTGIDFAFLSIAVLIALLALFIWFARRLISAATLTTPARASSGGIAAILIEATSSRWALLGGAAIFLYVGAEVAIGTQMALFLHSDAVLGVPLEQAGKMVSLYWGGAMVGRLIGSALLARVPAPALLATFASIACAICLFVFAMGGSAGGYAALTIGLFNSIMFPVIFTLTLERSSVSEAATSGFLCFSIVGGAAMPLLVGLVSGATSYTTAFAVPAICYALLLGFALAARRVVAVRGAAAVALSGH